MGVIELKDIICFYFGNHPVRIANKREVFGARRTDFTGLTTVNICCVPEGPGIDASMWENSSMHCPTYTLNS